MVDLSKLEEQTKKLKYLNDVVLSEHKEFIEYDVEDGTAIGFGLFNTNEIGVQRTFMSKGTIFPEHQHIEQEYILVYRGSVEICCDETYTINSRKLNDSTSPVILNSGDCAYFQPNANHKIKALEDSWVIGIIIPSVEGYPNAG